MKGDNVGVIDILRSNGFLDTVFFFVFNMVFLVGFCFVDGDDADDRRFLDCCFGSLSECDERRAHFDIVWLCGGGGGAQRAFKKRIQYDAKKG